MKRFRSLRWGPLALGAAAAFVFYHLLMPYRGFQGPQTFVDIPRGTSSKQIAALVARAGVVRTPWDFLAARALAPGHVLQAGEYRFVRAASAVEVYDRIARGDIFYYELSVPEGRNMFEIGQAAEQIGLFPAERFLAAARNPSMIRDLDPAAPNLEGYLFPSTYRLSRHTSPEGLCRIMTDKFRAMWNGRRLATDLHHTVTLASLIEKEAKLPGERPQVAAVFANRLERGMKLECDPTTIYASLLAGRYRGTIHRSDLASDDAYNTYAHAGLPPGPIANPGLASIEAALHPAASNMLYFVLRPDGSGAHQFSPTLAAHEAAVARYRHGTP